MMMMIRSMATTAVSRVLVRRSHDSRDKKGWRVAMFVLGPTLDNWCSPMENRNSFRLSWFWVKRFLCWKKFIILWEMWLKSLETFASGHQAQKHFQAAHNLSDSLSCMLLLWETFIRKRFKKMRFSKSLEPAKHMIFIDDIQTFTFFDSVNPRKMSLWISFMLSMVVTIPHVDEQQTFAPKLTYAHSAPTVYWSVQGIPNPPLIGLWGKR